MTDIPLGDGMLEKARKKLKRRKRDIEDRLNKILSNEPVEDESDNRPQGNDTKKKKPKKGK